MAGLTNKQVAALRRAPKKLSAKRRLALLEEIEEQDRELRDELLTPRWYPLDHHPEQSRLWTSPSRFRVVPAGRRSGKTERAKRYLVRKALAFHKFDDGLFIAGAPTRDHAKDIWWEDLKALTPTWAIDKVEESRLQIVLKTGTRIRVVGFDKPERAEGKAIDGCVLDEYADMKERVWSQSIRPALSTRGRPGWCWFIGKPRGRNHYYQLYKYAVQEDSPDWDGFHWISADIVDEEEIEAAKRELDPLTFEQEYMASFVNFTGRAYYPFEWEVHAKQRLRYNPDLPLVFCFDFNVEPGAAAVCQEQEYPEKLRKQYPYMADSITAVIGEVAIPRNSNTPAVCRKLIEDWGEHEGLVYCYGDATGGARKSSATRGTDWDIVRQDLRAHFGTRVKVYVEWKEANPPERARVNAVNTRLRDGHGMVHLLVDPVKAPYVAQDLDGVVLLEGGSGEIDKKYDKFLTHWSDGLGYYIYKKHPIFAHRIVQTPLY